MQISLRDIAALILTLVFVVTAAISVMQGAAHSMTLPMCWSCGASKVRRYTTMAFRSVPGAIVIGSSTAGADGNQSLIPLPGGLQTMISGIGVFYPDKQPTQRVGTVPNIEVKPTIAGIRDNRDEVLEEALRQILGPETPAAQIEALAKPQAAGLYIQSSCLYA